MAVNMTVWATGKQPRRQKQLRERHGELVKTFFFFCRLLDSLVCTCVFLIQSSSTSSPGPPPPPCLASGWSLGCTPGSSAHPARSPCQSCDRPRPEPRMCSGPGPGTGSPARRSDDRGWRSQSVHSVSRGVLWRCWNENLGARHGKI